MGNYFSFLCLFSESSQVSGFCWCPGQLSNRRKVFFSLIDVRGLWQFYRCCFSEFLCSVFFS
ncbi:Protein of unknown function [Pyronema omphalodes CBS 100304]|uniref:Uncharacterized protein n=1 Tax=Pyronema omphalodes (strain CBS 100304) TaxID=1076935 RepID=U4LJB4_PYROM|nr:Protein of unknown function [Pyronema omphalodes CBS 100304]